MYDSLTHIPNKMEDKQPATVSFEAGEAVLCWSDAVDALRRGHTLGRGEVGDTVLQVGGNTVLTRTAMVNGLGVAVKTATVFPENQTKGLPAVNGVVSVLSNDTGMLDGLVDFHLVTKWKTAADSLYAATMLARPDSKTILIVGAGTVGASLREAYGSHWPDAAFLVWNRTHSRAVSLAASYPCTEAVGELELESAVRHADIVTVATMSTEPIIRGEWLQPGQHIDLIGAYRSDMREVDDTAMQRCRVFVDCYDTTVEHIGELMLPLASGAITRKDILADLYEPLDFKRLDNMEITLFKNGGGAHLDLMIARHILTKHVEASLEGRK
eukprot:m.29396 g.29396  ORF g.29396 m.29396 type:complete len:327 (+) comp9160_c1_seq1:2640-3620(+)